jgi:hypothetical protein
MRLFGNYDGQPARTEPPIEQLAYLDKGEKRDFQGRSNEILELRERN